MARQNKLRRAILISQGLLFLVAGILYYIFRRDLWRQDFWDGHVELSVVIYTGIAAGLLIRIMTQVLGEAWPSFDSNMEQTVIRVIRQVRGWDLLWISILPAMIEELFFRGFLQPYLGIWLTSFVFALLHWGFVKELWAHGLHTFVISLFFGWLYIQTGSLISVMIAHFLNNLLATLYVQKKIPL